MTTASDFAASIKKVGLTKVDTDSTTGMPDVYIRRAFMGEIETMHKIAEQLQKEGTNEDVAAVIGCFVICACDEHGDRIFSDEDVEAVRRIPFDFAVDVAIAFAQLNNLDKGDLPGKGLATESTQSTQ